MSAREFDVAVVGLGGIGSGAAYWAARRGARVLGLERFELGHERGASQDHSRIIRLSYHAPEYVRFAQDAFSAWAELEADAGEELIVKTGGIDLFPAGGAIRKEDYTGSLDACGIGYELLDASEAMRRWPQWRLPDDVEVLFQAESGIAPELMAYAALYTALTDLVASFGEDSVVSLVNGLVPRVRKGEFTLYRSRQ